MKPVITRLYAVLVALALVGLIAWSGADWYQRQQQALVHTQTLLRQVAGQVSDLTAHGVPLVGETLNRAFVSVLTGEHRWKVVLLASPERGTEYYRGPRPTKPLDQEVPRWEPRPLSEVKVVLPVFRAQGDPMTAEGIYEFYGRAEIFSLLVAAGITLGVLVLLTLIVVFLVSRIREPEAAEEPVSEVPTPEPSLDLDEPLTFDSDPESEAKEEYWFDENLTLDDLPPLEEMPPLEESTPPGPSLFSPATGMGWESFLETRLDNELQRCAGQNQDLSLIVFGFKEGSVAPDAWGLAVREAFPSLDLDFEYGAGAAVVLPGRNLEQALKAARGFVESADRYLAGAVVHAGVASRTGRLLSAPTLLGEAASALRRSLAGSVRVLGLKTDPDRYRDYLAQSAP